MPLALHGQKEAVEVEQRGREGLKALGDAGEALGQLMLHPAFVAHPHAVKEALPQPHHLDLGLLAGPRHKPCRQLGHLGKDTEVVCTGSGWRGEGRGRGAHVHDKVNVSDFENIRQMLHGQGRGHY